MQTETKREYGKSSDQDHVKHIVSHVLSDGSLLEMVYRPEENRTLFCLARNGEISYEKQFEDKGQRFVPYSPHNNLLRNEVVLFPTQAEEYDSEAELVAAIRSFIHRYVDLTPSFELIASYYVMFTWLYDSFNELPFLKFRGDFGSGKSRVLIIVGSISFKPIFASGASTVSPLFRILDGMRGTLIIDEADFRFSDEKAEIIKILNNGNARGFPVLRSESIVGREYSPRAYAVYGPKLIASRGFFQDRALESRCLTEEMGGRRLREDIPLNLPAGYKQEALQLRNKLLTFRIRNFGKKTIDTRFVDRTIEPRLAQIFGPLLSVIENDDARLAVAQLARDYHKELLADRGLDLEAQVLGIIQDIRQSPENRELSVKEITDRFSERHSDDFERKITPHWIGYILRRKLGLKTEKRHGNFLIAPSETVKLIRLMEKYGITDIIGNDSVDSGDSADEVTAEVPIQTDDTDSS